MFSVVSTKMDVLIILLVLPVPATLWGDFDDYDYEVQTQDPSNFTENIDTSADAFELARILYNSMGEADPCEDFYTFACGSYGFGGVTESLNKTRIFFNTGDFDHPTLVTIRNITLPNQSYFQGFFNRNVRLNGGFWHTLHKKMTEDTAEDKCPPIAFVRRLYSKLIDPDLTKNNQLQDLRDLYVELDKMTTIEDLITGAANIGVHSIFRIQVFQDPVHYSKTILTLTPHRFEIERDNMVDNTLMAVQMREKYLEYIKTTLEVVFQGSIDSDSVAQEILDFELQLANITSGYKWQTDEEMEKSSLKDKFNYIDLATVIDNVLGEKTVNKLKVSDLVYFLKVGRVLQNKLSVVKKLLKFKIAETYGWILSGELFEETLEFQWRLAQGLKSRPTKNHVVLQWIVTKMPILMTRVFIDAVGLDNKPNEKAQFEEMINNTKNLLSTSIKSKMSWLDDATAEAAEKKIKELTVEYGYPGWIMDDERLTKEFELFSNDKDLAFDLLVRLKRCEFLIEVNKLHRESNAKQELLSTPPYDVAMFYHPLRNSVIIPVVLQNYIISNWGRPSFWKFGAIGSYIAREMFKAFTVGSVYSETGEVKNWWTKQSMNQFTEIINKLASRYDSTNFTLYGSFVNLDGSLYKQQDINDFAALSIALKGLLDKHNEENFMHLIPGFEDDKHWDGLKLFLLSYANFNCEYSTEEFLAKQVKFGHRAPAKFRINEVVANLPAFNQRFNCPEGSKMHRKDIIKLVNFT